MNKFEEFIRNLRGKGELEEFAEAVGTSVGYINSHLLPGKKVPRPQLWKDLVKASEGELDNSSMVEHFIERKKESA